MMKPQSSHSGGGGVLRFDSSLRAQVSIQESRQGGSGPDRSERVCFVGHTSAGYAATECGEEPPESQQIEQAESSR
ncbi:unnamed protein product [Gadus morhua 'NCC']